MAARAEVVVVGAGPVGLLTALELKQRNIDVMITDERDSSSARNFAVALHPRTVAMLADLGLVEPLRWQGRSFRHVAIFADGERRARLTLPLVGRHADGALTLPQNVLRTTLEHALVALGVEVKYGQRFASFEQDAEQVRVRFVHAGASARGKHGGAGGPEELSVVARFLIGADGHRSTVRESLGSALIDVGPPRSFAFFDVPEPAPSGDHAELVLGARGAAVYPVHGESTRYSLELESPAAAPLGRAELRTLLERRLPWHASVADSIEWSGARSFRRAIVERFGYGRVWLTGDACHQTSPLGVQSLNVGLREACELANAVSDCLDGRQLEHLVLGYAEQRRLEWRRLLGLGAEPTLGRQMPAWAQAHLTDLVSALPVSGADLDDMLDQLDLMLR
jgi:2-polyprenyl-6-methoxyphenol hydroxylase-like FAD-dependent oxidoreductase